MEIQYFGWSGVALQHSDTLIGFDLFGDTVTTDVLGLERTNILCLTHGHPEHAGSLRELLENPAAHPYLENTHLVSSSAVIEYVNRNHVLAPENVHHVVDGQTITLAGVEITAFTWVHMPLLPPGLWPKLEYIVQLAIHPVDLVRIGTLGLRLPANAPQLGFHVTYPDGLAVLNYAEGVHRLTDSREVEQVAAKFPADMLFFAVEPDDAEIIPRWVEMLAPSEEVYIYEAHRPWRELFHLPFIDLNDYAGVLTQRFPRLAIHALTGERQTLTRGGA